MGIHFKIVVPFYNVEKWARATASSVKLQDYNNFECVLIDDMSDDRSAAIMLSAIADDSRFKFIKNDRKKYALENIVYGIKCLAPEDEDVVMVLDGDDWFANLSVLSRLSEEYADQNCWMTYGSYLEYPSGVRGKFAKQLPQQIIEQCSYRSYSWCMSQLRTFKYKLWKKVKDSDLRDPAGRYYQMACDIAIMFPIAEMAGEHSRYIEDILYIYNIETPLNDHKKNNRQQMHIEHQLRNKQKYILCEDI